MIALDVAKVLWLGLFTWACVSTLLRVMKGQRDENV